MNTKETMKKVKYIIKHWKLGYHLLIRTNHFGVNNKLWEKNFKSLFGIPVWKQVLFITLIYPVVQNYKQIKCRAIHLGFLHPDTVRLLGLK